MPKINHWREPLVKHYDTPTVQFEEKNDEAVITIMQPEHDIGTDKALFYEIKLDKDEINEWAIKLDELNHEFKWD